MRSEDYLLDSNCFMTAARQYYARDFAPGFWSQLEGVMGHKDVFLLDIVREEIMNGGDDLATWLKELNRVHLLQRNDVEVFKQYRDKVLPHIGGCGFYKQNAIKRWHEFDIADPWLVAAALARGGAIVTLELPKGSRNRNQPSSAIKIPDVAADLGAHCIDLFEFMRIKGFYWG